MDQVVICGASRTPMGGFQGCFTGVSASDLGGAAIKAALESVAGNRRKAAEVLGIGERTLYRKISRYDIQE